MQFSTPTFVYVTIKLKKSLVYQRVCVSLHLEIGWLIMTITFKFVFNVIMLIIA